MPLPSAAPLKTKLGLWGVSLLLAGLLLRALLLIHPSLDSDVAVVGLMAMRFLHGELTPFYWGQSYGGSLEPLLAALAFWLAGPSPRVLDAVPALVSLLHVYLMYRLALPLLGRAGALASLALTALGPYYLLAFSTTARGLHAELLALGAGLLCLAQALVRTPSHRPAPVMGWLGLGLLAGLLFWTNMLAAGILAPVLLLLWRRFPRLPFSLAGLALTGGFLAGSAPLWWYNLHHGWESFAFSSRLSSAAALWESLVWLLDKSLPVLWGAQRDLAYAWLLPGLSQAILVLCWAITACALLAWGRHLLRFLLGRQAQPQAGLPLLAALGVAGVFCLLGGVDLGTHRYLLGLYLVWPLMAGWAFARLWAWGSAARGLAGLGLALLLGSNLLGVYLTSPLGDPDARARQMAQDYQASQVISHFQERGVTHVYCPEYWLAPLWTFLAREQVVFAQPFQDRRPAYVDELLRAPRTGLVVHQGEAPPWRRTLQALGASWREETVADQYQAFTGIQPPPEKPRPLARQDWRATAQPEAGKAAQAWDCNLTTRWSTHQPQAPGQWYQLDLGDAVPGVCQVLLFSGQAGDSPRSLRLEGSLDGQQWFELARLKERIPGAWWSGDKPVFTPGSPWEEIRFPPRELRYLRLSQTGLNPASYWSLLEVVVGALEQEARPAPDWPAAADWLTRQLPGQVRLYCEAGLAAWLPQRLAAQPRPQARPPWLREYLRPENLLPSQEPLWLAVRDQWAGLAQEGLASAGWTSQAASQHGVTLIQAQPPGGQAIAGSFLLEAPGQQYLSPAEIVVQEYDGGGAWRDAPVRAVWPAELYWTGLLPLPVQPYPLLLLPIVPVEDQLRVIKAPWATGDPPAGLRLRQPGAPGGKD